MRPLAAVLVFLCSNSFAFAADEFDFVIYGGTSAAFSAAVQAQRMGKSAVIIEPRQHIGGLTVSGLGATDSGNKAAIGGISREFYQQVKAHYDGADAWRQETQTAFKGYRAQDDAMWTFEPHVADSIIQRMLKSAGTKIVLGESLNRETGVEMHAGRIIAITTRSGQRFTGKCFIDATYEGDLLAAANVAFTVGRESNATYGEQLNGIQVAHARSHQFVKPVDGYRIPGNPQSGLLPGIGDGPGVDGEADHRMQAYNFRICMTDNRANQVPFPKPADYDELEYELLLRNFEAGDLRIPLSIIMMPNRKTDVNNNFAVSTDYIGMNYDYPTATDEQRAEITQAHASYVKGLFWTLANHPRVPAEVRQSVSRWGWAKDEFLDNDHFPFWMYIREGRRMVSDYVQTELDCRRVRLTPDSVGLGSYNMDSHNCQRYIDSNGHVRNEGDVQVSPRGPYMISYKAIVPRKKECTNLLVPVCLSSSHIAYGSIRMEPVFMVLGQSAATAGVIAIDRGIAVQDVPYADLRERLLADKQVLDIPEGSTAAALIDAKSLPGIVIDNTEARATGTWGVSTSVHGFVGSEYLHDAHEGIGEKSLMYSCSKVPPGRYEVRLSYTPQANRATNALLTIQHGGETTTVRVNQRKAPQLDKIFTSLGTFTFTGAADEGVTISNADADGHVIADAIQLLPAK